MYNRCPHLDEGILPVQRMNYARNYSGGGGSTTVRRSFRRLIFKLTIYSVISLIILLPRKSLAAAPKYETAYACEGKTLTIECNPSFLISLIRANYGRFSITICNDHGNVDWSVNCMSPKSLRVLHSKCTHKQNCSIVASTNMFGDPCPGTHKYLEAHYQCISAAQTSTTTTRPSPPWLITNSPSVWSTSSIRSMANSSTPEASDTTTARIGSIHEMILPPKSVQAKNGDGGKGRTDIHLAGGRPPILDSPYDKGVLAFGHRSTTPASRVLQSSRVNDSNSNGAGAGIGSKDGAAGFGGNRQLGTTAITEVASTHPIEPTAKPTDGYDENVAHNQPIYTTQSTVLVNNYGDSLGDSSYYCGPTNVRNLFWNVTRIGEVNVQPCPGGAFGIAKWRCVLVQIDQQQQSLQSNRTSSDCGELRNCDRSQRHQRAAWHPQTPDLTQCRSVWINNLEISVNQRDSSLISIANDLSQITSSKTLYGGDMLVTTKIIQTMSEKMAYDVETFPDQKQREAIITELLNGVVKTGSNLLDISHELTWLDLSFEDQMRVATSLLTGLEDNAFLLADSIIRERSVVQKVKNILLSIRVLETRNIIGNEIFPDAKQEQWHISDDRIELPRGALIENSEGGLVRIVFVAFDRLEAILKPSYDQLDMKFSKSYVQQNQSKNSLHSNRILNSKVISASLGKGRHIQLSQPIRLVLRHLKTENVTNPVCVFWNYIDHAWSEDGCHLEQTNHSHTICMCNHLTNFAILMDATDETALSLLSLFDNNMRILIYISIAICIIFIIIAILTLKLFNGIFIKSTRSSIYKNIYVCLFIIEILFLLGIEQSETSVLCGFTTAFLHCFVLSAIAWLFFEGFQLYLTLTTDDMLLEVENTSKLIWYYLLSYGLSFTIVAISLAIDPGTYTQSDFCVLMEQNALFYTTFLTPVVLFVMGVNAYSILAVYVMCKKSKTTLKNKEHSRLTSVRFDLRCSFLFLIILSAGWIFAYLYLRKAKLEEDASNTYGFLFITFNSLMGLYIFVFHCIQNEKIRREYRKYIRQNSWLPKCLRCSKTSSISSSSTSQHHHQQYGTAASKKSPITIPTGDQIDTSILSSVQYPDQTTTIESIPRISNHRHNILLERSTAGTMRGIGNTGLGIGIVGGHTSPTSSAGSTHLIFNSLQSDQSQDYNFQVGQPGGQYYPQQQQQSIAGDLTAKNLNTYDDKYLNYDCKSKRLKQHPLGSGSGGTSRNTSGTSHPQHHEYFYWTEKSHHQKKKINGDSTTSSQKGDTTTHNFYPSYRKTRQYLVPGPGGKPDGDKLAGDCDFPETDSRLFHYPSDEDHAESHLIHVAEVIPSGGSGPTVLGTFRSQQQQLHHHHPRHKYVTGGDGDFINIASMALPAIPVSSTASSSSYYDRGLGGIMTQDEPVYEEILSNRISGLHDDKDDDDDDDDGDEDEVNDKILVEERYNRLRRMLNSNKDETGMSSLRQSFNRHQIKPSNFDSGTQSKNSAFKNSQNCIKLGSGIATADRGGITSENAMRQHQQQLHHQQQQQQQLHLQQQHVVGRNLSAILDENNTVVCYLEPLPK